MANIKPVHVTKPVRKPAPPSPVVPGVSDKALRAALPGTPEQLAKRTGGKVLAILCRLQTFEAYGLAFEDRPASDAGMGPTIYNVWFAWPK